MATAIEYASQIAYSSKKVLQFSYDMAVKYKDAPGIFCECGCAAGAQIIAMAAGAPNKTIYAFDSFEGIPLPSNKDNQMPGIKFLTEAEQKALPDPGKQVLETTGATAVTMESFLTHIKDSGISNPERVIPIRGWFEDTTWGYPEEHHHMGQIAILRLDGDLYNSTLVCLQNLYPFVIKGGLVIIDDWALPGCRQAVQDYFREFMNGEYWLDFAANVKLIQDENSTVAYWFK